MTNAKHQWMLVAAACLAMAGGAASASDASQLGTTQTPLGGEMAGSKDGRIPAWKEEVQASDGWSWGKLRKDYWKYKNDKSLYTINAANMGQYAAMLTPGQQALLKQNPGFQMEVYPTRRSCGVPEFVAENTRKNVATAKMGADGWSLKSAVVPGTPFPMPSNGAQAMMNMKMRYRGIGVEYQNGYTMVSPRRGSEDWIMAGFEQNYYFPAGKKGSNNLSETGNVEYYTYFTYKSPAALAGQALAADIFLDNPNSETFYYFPGQRRVRRMPAYAYDAPQIGFENQYLLDETNMFTGTLDRFDWKIVGKKEMLVPYNVLGVYDFKAKIHDVVGRNALAASTRRYELHRVWVIEGTVKQGARHVSPKRTYYLDEDSWNAVLAEDYDVQGALWKVREGYVVPVYETGTCDVLAFGQYNLPEGRYVFDFSTVGAGVDVKWLTESRGERTKAAFYTSENLRAISDR
ncbi:MAG TPA: DUF1329 domain-containing protein [Burkholderiaceae bacterium]|nr:DUF1329 domain-containing protein [Burkholderiaceae bacterium]